MRKRGQAFLISTVILITILVAFLTIGNYSKKTEIAKLKYKSEQIQIESEKVMDYDLKNNENKIEEFKQIISNELDEDTEIYFIDGTPLNCNNYNGLPCTLLQNQNNISVTIGDLNYEFPYFQEGKHFYYIIIKEIKGEKYVYTN